MVEKPPFFEKTLFWRKFGSKTTLFSKNPSFDEIFVQKTLRVVFRVCG